MLILLANGARCESPDWLGIRRASWVQELDRGHQTQGEYPDGLGNDGLGIRVIPGLMEPNDSSHGGAVALASFESVTAEPKSKGQSSPFSLPIDDAILHPAANDSLPWLSGWDVSAEWVFARRALSKDPSNDSVDPGTQQGVMLKLGRKFNAAEHNSLASEIVFTYVEGTDRPFSQSSIYTSLPRPLFTINPDGGPLILDTGTEWLISDVSHHRYSTSFTDLEWNLTTATQSNQISRRQILGLRLIRHADSLVLGEQINSFQTFTVYDGTAGEPTAYELHDVGFQGPSQRVAASNWMIGPQIGYEGRWQGQRLSFVAGVKGGLLLNFANEEYETVANSISLDPTFLPEPDAPAQTQRQTTKSRFIQFPVLTQAYVETRYALNQSVSASLSANMLSLTDQRQSERLYGDDGWGEDVALFSLGAGVQYTR